MIVSNYPKKKYKLLREVSGFDRDGVPFYALLV
jgi:hypothetical protein